MINGLIILLSGIGLYLAFGPIVSLDEDNKMSFHKKPLIAAVIAGVVYGLLKYFLL